MIFGVDVPTGPVWSEEVEQAAWIAERLAPFNACQVTSVVAHGFAAYSRGLHPIETPHRSHGRLVRWAQVAAWSGMPLGRDSQFHFVALPPTRPDQEAPWSGQGPRQASLYPPDAEVMAETCGASQRRPSSAGSVFGGATAGRTGSCSRRRRKGRGKGSGGRDGQSRVDFLIRSLRR
jgi:hypothetical protein